MASPCSAERCCENCSTASAFLSGFLGKRRRPISSGPRTLPVLSAPLACAWRVACVVPPAWARPFVSWRPLTGFAPKRRFGRTCTPAYQIVSEESRPSPRPTRVGLRGYRRWMFPGLGSSPSSQLDWVRQLRLELRSARQNCRPQLAAAATSPRESWRARLLADGRSWEEFEEVDRKPFKHVAPGFLSVERNQSSHKNQQNAHNAAQDSRLDISHPHGFGSGQGLKLRSLATVPAAGPGLGCRLGALLQRDS